MIKNEISTFDTTNIQLKIDNRRFSFWKSAKVHAAIGEFCREATFEVSDAGLGKAEQIQIDAPCQVICDNLVVMTGYIDDVAVNYGGNSHKITIKARSKTCDLVDCSIETNANQFNKTSAKSVIEALCNPFGIRVIFNAPDFSLSEFNVQAGDSPSSAIEKICKSGGLFYTDTADGALLIFNLQVTSPVAALYATSEQTNILIGDGHFSSRDRFSKYILQSQTQPSDEDTDATVAYTQMSTVLDSGVKRHRPKVIIANDDQNASQDQSMAEIEKMRRSRGAANINYTINGWKDARGQIWRAGVMVSVRDDYMRICDDYIVASFDLSIATGLGRKTQMKITHPGAIIRDYHKGRRKKGQPAPWYWVGEKVY